MKQIQSVFITKNNHIRAWKQLIGYVGRDEKDDNKQKYLEKLCLIYVGPIYILYTWAKLT